MNKYNTLPRRVMARLIDGSVLMTIYLLIVLIFSFSSDTEKMIFVIVYPLYYVGLMSMYGQTVGMYAVGTKLVLSGTEDMPDIMHIMLRELMGVYLVIVSLLFLGRFAQGEGDMFRLFIYTQTSWLILHFLVVSMSKTHRTIHDFLAHTVVIKVIPFGGKKKTTRNASIL